MSIILDHFPGSRLGKSFRTMRGPKKSLGTEQCYICKRPFEKLCGAHMLCGRKKCLRERERQRRLTNAPGNPEHPERYGPSVEPQAPPFCVCGSLLKFGSDALTGTSIEYCPHCRVERPVPLVGKRIHDQREHLEAELVGSVERAHTLVRNPNRPEYCGDQFRQVAHKRGAA